jgi:hypothetical protein
MLNLWQQISMSAPSNALLHYAIWVPNTRSFVQGAPCSGVRACVQDAEIERRSHSARAQHRSKT